MDGFLVRFHAGGEDRVSIVTWRARTRPQEEPYFLVGDPKFELDGNGVLTVKTLESCY